MGKNGKTEIEHPKPMLEVLDNTREAIEGYREAKQLSFSEAALVLIFNELRCMHFHLDYFHSHILTQEADHAGQRHD